MKTRSERTRRFLKAAGRGILLSGLLLAAAAAAWLAWAGSLLRLDDFKLREIRFQGATHTPIDSVEGLIRTSFGEDLLTIDLDRVRSLVEGEDWVESATARRRLPDRLEIVVRERQPVAVAAIDDQLQVVDANGVALAPFGPDFQDLDRPLVRGLKSLAVENAAADNAARMKVYLKILRELDAADPDYARSISEIDVSEPRRVTVVPSREPIPVLLGEEDFVRRYRTFLSGLDYYRELKQRHGAIESIDVTLEDKIIVHTPDADLRKSGGAQPRETS